MAGAPFPHRRAPLLGAAAAALVVVLFSPVLTFGRQGETAALAAEPLPGHTTAEVFVPNAGGYVVAMAFAPDGRLFYTTKGGFGGVQTATVRIVENGALRPTPFLAVPVLTGSEQGLLGLALDPNFAVNHYVYVYYTAPPGPGGTPPTTNRLVRFTEDPATQTADLASQVLLLEQVAPAGNHNGGNLHFGPDGKLYLSIGDQADQASAQDLTKTTGKIHRFNPDGSIPLDNPFVAAPAGAVPSIWSYGHRNSFDFTFDPLNGHQFFTENGPTCDDEVNLGQKAGNFGWPLTFDGTSCVSQPPPGTIPPLYIFPATIGITGIEVYEGAIVPWQGSLFWCAVNTGDLYRGTLDGTRTQIIDVATVTGAPDCAVDVLTGPDGALYLSGGAGGSVISRIREWDRVLVNWLPLVYR